MGTYGCGTSKGNPSTVSLDAYTMFRMPARRAVWNTLNVQRMVSWNVATSLRMPGAGIAARCTIPSNAGFAACHPGLPCGQHHRQLQDATVSDRIAIPVQHPLKEEAP